MPPCARGRAGSEGFTDQQACFLGLGLLGLRCPLSYRPELRPSLKGAQMRERGVVSTLGGRVRPSSRCDRHPRPGRRVVTALVMETAAAPEHSNVPADAHPAREVGWAPRASREEPVPYSSRHRTGSAPGLCPRNRLLTTTCPRTSGWWGLPSGARRRRGRRAAAPGGLPQTQPADGPAAPRVGHFCHSQATS